MIRRPSDPIKRVVILKADRLCAEMLRQVAARVLPEASFQLVRHVGEASAIAAEAPVDLLLTGVRMLDGDVLDFLNVTLGARGSIMRALVISSRKEARLLKGLCEWDISGVFDPSAEGPEQLEEALRAAVAGEKYWSRSVLEHLTSHSLSSDSICQLLTPGEQFVLAVIGDGCDDIEASRRLELKPSTIHSTRRDLHRKLRVTHRGELVRLAVQHGFVGFTPDKVLRPGFEMLRSACRSQR